MNRTLMAGMALAALGLAGSARAQTQQSEDTRKQVQQPEASKLRTMTMTADKVDPKLHTVTFEAHVKPEANFKTARARRSGSTI